MSTESQIKANRRNARKSTGPKTAEGKAAVAQNALKHGLFAHENVIKCEKQADFDCFREELLAGLAPAGGVEAMMAERIVSLSWRLKRVERMNSEVIDVMIAKIETGSLDRSQRKEAGLLDPESGRSELALGWVMIKDFSKSNVLERLLMYEKRIESSLYKAMNELQKLQHIRKKEEVQVKQPAILDGHRDEAAAHRGRDAPWGQAHKTQGRNALATKAASPSEDQTGQMKKQSQCQPSVGCTKLEIQNPQKTHSGTHNCAKQTQSSDLAGSSKHEVLIPKQLHL